MTTNNTGSSKNTMVVLVFFAFIICFALGVWGWRSEGYKISDAIYNTIKLLVMDGAGKVNHWQLEIARFILPLFTVVTIINVILRAAGKQLTLLKLRFSPKKTLVFGTNKSSLIAAANLPMVDDKLFIDLSEDGLDFFSELSQKAGTIIHLQQITDKKLNSLNIRAAKILFILGDNDENNLALAQNLIALLGELTPRFVINIDSQAILRITCQEKIFTDYRERGGEITWVNVFRQASRTLLQQYPPLEQSSLSYQNNIHIAIVGLDDFSRELILSLARNSVYLSEAPVVISVFSDNPAAYKAFLANYPALSARVDTLGFGGFSLRLSIRHYPISWLVIPPKVLAQAIDIVGKFCRVYVSGDSDYTVLETAKRVQQSLAVIQQPSSIVACLPGTHFYDTSKLQEKQNDNTASAVNRIDYFSVIAKNIDAQYNAVNELLGQSVHAAYKTLYHNNLQDITPSEFPQRFAETFQTCVNEATKEWSEKLEEDFRHSSRCSADHFFVKLRELGYELQPLTETTTADKTDEMLLEQLKEDISQHQEALNQLEHRRFCHERFIDGWLYADNTDKPRQLNATLIPFSRLPEGEKHKDEAIIMAIPLMLSQPLMAKYFRLV